MSSTSLGGILANAPMPLEDPIAQPKRPGFENKPDPQEGRLTRAWLDFFTTLTNTVAASSPRIASVDLEAQSGDIGATDITNGAIAAGLYRFSYYFSIATTDAGTITVTLDWTEGGIARSFTGPGINSGTLTASESGPPGGLIRVDGASPIRYSTTTGLSTATYNLAVTLETMQ